MKKKPLDNPDTLFGDDFGPDEIRDWFLSEENGYADLGYIDSEDAVYVYHSLNEKYGWNATRNNLGNVLSLGGAYAAEFERVADRITSLTVIEPAKKFWRKSAYGLDLIYRMPQPTGELSFPDSSFDTVTVFGVLHHIPNVSFVLSELARVLKPGGVMLLREPIISMGDWNHPRPGLTRNERGLPLAYLERVLSKIELLIVDCHFIGFRPWARFLDLFGLGWFSNRFTLSADHLFCRIFLFNYNYHRTDFLSKLSPSTVFMVITKQ